MKRVSNCYLRTFPNTQEGNEAYKLFVYEIRRVIKGGRLTKMFRGGTRNVRWFTSKMTGKQIRWGGSCSLNDGTHFDVYLYGGRWVNGKRTEPRFFNFVLNERR